MTCDECGARIPDTARSAVHKAHAESCSLHPAAVVIEEPPAVVSVGGAGGRAGVPFTCPACGHTEFTVGQWQWATQTYDALTDQWGSSRFAYEGDQVVGLHCVNCESDCTAAAMAAGWELVHDTPLVRHDQREGVAICPPLRIQGRNGRSRSARWAVGEQGRLRLWRGWTNERHPLLEFDAELPTLIQMTKELLELLLDRYESDRQAELAQRREDARDVQRRS